jgi:type IV pilus assembly protein PilN
MIRINLIPHREAFRKQQIIEYIVVFVAAITVAIALVVAVDIWATKDLTSSKDEYALLKSKNASLTKKIGELRNLDSLRKEVEDKLKIVDELQAGRFRSLTTLEAIAKSLPQNIWLTDIEDKNSTIKLKGYGESSQSIANFMRTLDKHRLFNAIRLSVDEAAVVEGANVRKFSLSFHRLTLQEQKAEQKKAEAKNES